MAAEIGKNLVGKTFDDFEAGCSVLTSFLRFSSMQKCQPYNS